MGSIKDSPLSFATSALRISGVMPRSQPEQLRHVGELSMLTIG